MLDPSRYDPMTGHCSQEIDGLLKEVPKRVRSRICDCDFWDPLTWIGCMRVYIYRYIFTYIYIFMLQYSFMNAT